MDRKNIRRRKLAEEQRHVSHGIHQGCEGEDQRQENIREGLWPGQRGNGVATLVPPATTSEYHHRTPPFLKEMEQSVPPFIVLFPVYHMLNRLCQQRDASQARQLLDKVSSLFTRIQGS